jgi:aerobic-type carbon monoxide dehydrogenase small subunit (CoxS/CutS family)
VTVPQDHIAVTCLLNGKDTRIEGDPAQPVVAALRARGLFSVRETCALGVCGTCTVLLDGEPISACILPLYALDGRTVRTTEGLEEDGELSELQQQFIESQAFQCSFCTPGFLMSAQALLDRTTGELSSADISEGLHGHLCRCGCYAAISEAVASCASRRRTGGQTG